MFEVAGLRYKHERLAQFALNTSTEIFLANFSYTTYNLGYLLAIQ